MSSLVEED